MPRRRPLTGRPLLIATTAALSAGCNGKSVDNAPVGNLMPPAPMLCVTTLPEGASVAFNGAPAENNCFPVRSSDTTVMLHVFAPGYQPYQDEVELSPRLQELTIRLEPEADAPPPPVGNLIPPPQPPPQPPQPPPDGEEGRQ